MALGHVFFLATVILAAMLIGDFCLWLNGQMMRRQRELALYWWINILTWTNLTPISLTKAI